MSQEQQERALLKARELNVTLLEENKKLKAQVARLKDATVPPSGRLEAAIRRHHAMVVKRNDFSADERLWGELGLVA